MTDREKVRRPGGSGGRSRWASLVDAVRHGIGRVRQRVNIAHLLCVMLVVAMVAALRIISYVSHHPALEGYSQLRLGLVIVLGLFTLVVVALGTALWSWGDRLELERESNLRARKLLAAIYGLHDALVAVDRQGRVIGCNQQARALSRRDRFDGAFLNECFAFFDEDRMLEVSVAADPIETTVADRDTVYRVRCFPSESMNLLLLSDVTVLREQASRRELESERELIGRIAQGVSHDFNNILCAISGHAALMGHQGESLSDLQRESLDTIVREAGRGATLAQQLVDLSVSEAGSGVSAPLEDTLEQAGTILQRTLPAGWEVACRAGSGSGVATMPHTQLEQLVIRFGLQVADEYEDPRILHIEARPAGEGPLGDVDDQFGAVVFLFATPLEAGPDLEAYAIDERPPLSRDGGGVVQSVVLSILERYGGSQDVLVHSSGHHGYRVCLPFVGEEEEKAATSGILPAALSGWHVLLAQPASERHEKTAVLLQGLGCEVDRTNNLVGVISRFEAGTRYHVVLISAGLLGTDPPRNLRRLIQVDPAIAFAVIGAPEDIPEALKQDLGLVKLPLTVSSLRLGMLGAVRAAEQREDSAA